MRKQLRRDYYVGSPSDRLVINSRLLSFKNPTSISRSPRNIESRTSWKALEWRTWLMFYCLICLKGILPRKYLIHLSKLVGAMEILLSDSISSQRLEVARKFLENFVCDFQLYFGKNEMTYNVHLLLHVADSV